MAPARLFFLVVSSVDSGKSDVHDTGHIEKPGRGLPCRPILNSTSLAATLWWYALSDLFQSFSQSNVSQPSCCQWARAGQCEENQRPLGWLRHPCIRRRAGLFDFRF